MEEKIEKYFASPSLTIDEYRENYGDSISPLYRLRRDIYYCFGIDPNTKQKFINSDFAKITNLGPAPLAGVILMQIGISMLKKTIDYGFSQFAQKYMGVSSEKDLKPLNWLRNAAAHTNYGLRYCLNAKERKKYGFERVIFHLSLGFKEMIKEIPSGNAQVKAYGVNMLKLFEVFEETIDRLSLNIQKDKRISSVFDQNVRPGKHWVWSPNKIKFKWVN